EVGEVDRILNHRGLIASLRTHRALLCQGSDGSRQATARQKYTGHQRGRHCAHAGKQDAEFAGVGFREGFSFLHGIRTLGEIGGECVKTGVFLTIRVPAVGDARASPCRTSPRIIPSSPCPSEAFMSFRGPGARLPEKRSSRERISSVSATSAFTS